MSKEDAVYAASSGTAPARSPGTNHCFSSRYTQSFARFGRLIVGITCTVYVLLVILWISPEGADILESSPTLSCHPIYSLSSSNSTSAPKFVPPPTAVEGPRKSSTFVRFVTCTDTFGPIDTPICDDVSNVFDFATLNCNPISSSVPTIPALTEKPHPKIQNENPIDTPKESLPSGSCKAYRFSNSGVLP